MATYVNNLRLTELATGEGSGTWGTTTNTSLELIGEALGYNTQNCFASDADATTTVADGATDPARAMYFKVTSSATLTATRTLTIAPNTLSRVMFIENATTGSQSIAISQGSGANVTIATGKTAVVYLDGAGSTAAVVDAMAGVDPGVTDTLAEVLVAGNTSGANNLIIDNGQAITTNTINETTAASGVTIDSVLLKDDGVNATNLEITNLKANDGTAAGSIANSTGVVTLASSVLTTADINGGTIDGTVIGGSTAAAGSFTTLQADTSLNVDGTVTADGLVVEPSSATGLTYAADGTNSYINFEANSVSDSVQLYAGQSSGGYFSIGTKSSGGSLAERMRIDSSGNVGIGTSSPSNTVTITNGSSGATEANGSIVPLMIENSSSAYINFLTPNNANAGFLFSDPEGNNVGQMQYLHGSDALVFATNASERMRIDSSGNVGIGTDSPDNKLHVYKGANGHSWSFDSGDGFILENSDSVSINLATPSANSANILFSDADARGQGRIVYAHGSDYMGFHTAGIGNERMRIDSSGNLLVGTTNTANIASATPNVITDKSYGINDTVNKAAFQIDRISFDSSNYYVLNASAIGVRLNNGATAWTTQSDETLKENITELTGVLSKVQNLRCVSYNLKSQNADDVKLGFIAQDWQTEFPEVVHDEPSDGTLGINYTETIPVLLKAIQEQTEIINDLRARVAQLEGVN